MVQLKGSLVTQEPGSGVLYTMAEIHIGGKATLKKWQLKGQRQQPLGEGPTCNATGFSHSTWQLWLRPTAQDTQTANTEGETVEREKQYWEL